MPRMIQLATERRGWSLHPFILPDVLCNILASETQYMKADLRTDAKHAIYKR